MYIWEVIKNKQKPSATAAQGKTSRRDGQTEFEKNASKLRSKERKLNPKRPVAPIKHRAS
jgi:hypothetical protein